MRSPPITQPPGPPGRAPSWLLPALLSVIAVVTMLLLVFIGWPLLALLFGAGVFGSGVVVGYRGARNEDFSRHVDRWLE